MSILVKNNESFTPHSLGKRTYIEEIYSVVH